MSEVKLPETLETWIEPGGGHRPYPAHPEVVRWLLRTLFPNRPVPQLPPSSFADWCDKYDVKLERLYGTPLHLRGATVTGLDVQYQPPQSLAVLSDSELGDPSFALIGWLQKVAPAN